MNIQEAVKISLETQKAISRKEYKNTLYLIPTNNANSLVALFSKINEEYKLPCRGWQPFADDLIADDWFVTDMSYKHSILDCSRNKIKKAIDINHIYS